MNWANRCYSLNLTTSKKNSLENLEYNYLISKVRRLVIEAINIASTPFRAEFRLWKKVVMPFSVSRNILRNMINLGKCNWNLRTLVSPEMVILYPRLIGNTQRLRSFVFLRHSDLAVTRRWRIIIVSKTY